MAHKIRHVRIEGNLAYVPLGRRTKVEAVINAEDALLVGQYNWHLLEIKRKDGSVRARYVARNDWSSGKRQYVYLHRVIAQTPANDLTDHRDGNGLNNTRDNLRTATRSENQHNSCMRRNNTSGFKGVSFSKRVGRWAGLVCHNWKNYHVGYFDTAELAAIAVAKKRTELHGDFARHE